MRSITLTPNQIVAIRLEEARHDKRWTQTETVKRLACVGLRWSRPNYAMAICTTIKGRRIREFSADEVLVFAKVFGMRAWQFFVPPTTWRGRRVLVKLPNGPTLDSDAVYDLAAMPISPEPQSEAERERQESFQLRMMRATMEFMRDQGLLPKPAPVLNELELLPPDVQAELGAAFQAVLDKRGIKLLAEPAEPAEPTALQMWMLRGQLEKLPRDSGAKRDDVASGR